ncbi:hypothetical protein ACFHYQ_08400 [Sphaerimonospora cavernae]|uniref:Gluconate 2-dehydrogenase subunit 3-like protein n=1 Tax=Sphaerimonospora cavernae TaxID=1740611 RepID=A0ABV6U380_9ACTN
MSRHDSRGGRPDSGDLADGPLDVAESEALARLLDLLVPYPSQPGGPIVGDTVVFVRRRLAAEDAAWLVPLRAGLAAAAGREEQWLAAAENQSGELFEQLRAWAWDGFLAHPRWGVNRGGLGWTYFGWAGPPRERES